MATASCSDAASGLGYAIVFAWVLTAPAAAADFDGNTAAGRTLFGERCIACHTPQRLAGRGDQVRNDLRRIDEQMAGVGLLWEQEVRNLRAFLQSLKPIAPEQP